VACVERRGALERARGDEDGRTHEESGPVEGTGTGRGAGVMFGWSESRGVMGASYSSTIDSGPRDAVYVRKGLTQLMFPWKPREGAG
jgi:hypothetical protein